MQPNLKFLYLRKSRYLNTWNTYVNLESVKFRVSSVLKALDDEKASDDISNQLYYQKFAIERNKTNKTDCYYFAKVHEM